MPKLIKNGEIVDNNWQILRTQEECANTDISDGYWVVPLDYYLDAKEGDKPLADTCGVIVSGDTPATSLAPVLANLPLICIDFPVFTDGRGFSLARILREHHEYGGDIRAIGEFLQDQLYYLSRCGFSSFEVAEDADLESINNSLHDFSVSYQAAVDEAQPLFRRRN